METKQNKAKTITYYKSFFKGIQVIIFGSLLEFDHVNKGHHLPEFTREKW